MSYFNKDLAAYSKLELDSNHPIPAVYHEENNLNKIPSIPSTTYSSRFEEQLYPILSNEEYHQRLNFRRNVTPPPPPINHKANKQKNCCRFLTHIAFLLGVALIVISIGFTFLSRPYINQAIDQSCPVACVTTCYRHLPFYQPSIQCNEEVKAACDVNCGPVGMAAANIYAILFFVCVVLGVLLVVAQVIHACLIYYCFDYTDYSKTEGGPFV